jgi:polar amino acid transport system substrate-binding protein
MPNDSAERAAEALAATGTIRAAINFGNPVLAQRDTLTGEARGVSVDLAHAIGQKLRVPVALVAFESAGAVTTSLAIESWDLAFLAIDPAREASIVFTAPYVVIEGTYMVPAASSIESTEEVDRPGIRIAVGAGTAHDLLLSRTIKHAEIVRAPSSLLAWELFERGGSEVAAGIRQPLVSFAESHGGLRLLADRFTAVHQAVAIPRRLEAASEFLRTFVEETKASGFIAERLVASGQADAQVAPPQADVKRSG